MVRLRTYLSLSAIFLLGYTTSASQVSSPSSSSAQLEASSYYPEHGDTVEQTPHFPSHGHDNGHDDDHAHHHHHHTISTGGAGGIGGARGEPGQPGQPGQPGEQTITSPDNGVVITSKGGDGEGDGDGGAPGASGLVIDGKNPDGLNVSDFHSHSHSHSNSEHGGHPHPVSSVSPPGFKPGGSVPVLYWYSFAAVGHAVGYYVLTR